MGRSEHPGGRSSPGQLGELWDKAQAETRLVIERVEAELRDGWQRLVALSDVPRDELERIRAEWGGELHERLERLEELRAGLSRFRPAAAVGLAARLRRLRTRLDALEFRIESLEKGLGGPPGGGA